MLREARKAAKMSLEQAASLSYMDRKALMRRENEEVPIYPDEARKLAEIYGQPWLKQWYCSVCAIGKEYGFCFEQIDATLAMLRFIKGFETLGNVRNVLMDIFEDGNVDEQEMAAFKEACNKLTYFQQSIFALKMIKEKTTVATGG